MNISKTLIVVLGMVAVWHIIPSFVYAVDVTSRLELVGNPTTIVNSVKQVCAPDTSQPYSRNPWDLQVYEGFLYIGSGNSSNLTTTQAGNAGPVKVCKYDPHTQTFSADTITSGGNTVLPEEQLEKFRVIDDRLYIPGNDPTTGGGKIYFRTPQSTQWQAVSVGSVDHVYDVAQNSTMMVVGTGTSTSSSKYARTSTSPSHSSWTNMPFFDYPHFLITKGVRRDFEYACCTRTMGTFVFNGKLYGSPLYGPVFEFTTSGVQKVREDMFFPGVSTATGSVGAQGYSIRRDATLNGVLVYIAGKTFDDHQWLPSNAYIAENETTIRPLNLGPNREPWDVLAHNNAVYILTATVDPTAVPSPGDVNPSNPYKKYVAVSVFTSTDFTNWTEILTFSVDPDASTTRPFARSFARSFEIIDNDMYFGIGTTLSPLSPDSGNIVRLSDIIASEDPPTPTSIQSKPGDVTQDNQVNLADLSIVLSNFGTSGARDRGDVTGDGQVNLSDLSLVLANFGS